MCIVASHGNTLTRCCTSFVNLGDPVSFSSQRQEEAKTLDPRIESGMTRNANAKSRAPAGVAAPLRHFFFCHPCAREDPVSFSFAKTGRSKDPGSPIESGMTRNANAKSRAPAGAAAPQSRIFFGGEDCLSEALVLSNAKELSIKNRALGKADSFLRQTQDRREILRFAQDKLGMTTERHPKGRAWAPMVLDPFAETKGSRRVGATPHKPSSTPFQTSPTIGMTIPVLAAPRTARKKTKRKGLTSAPAIRTIPPSLLEVLQSRIVPLLSNHQSQKKERKA